MRKVAFYILLVIAEFSVTAQEIGISAAFDSARIYVGDQINFTINVEQPAGIQLKIPSFKDTLIKNLEIIEGPDVDSVPITGGNIRITEKYLVTSFDSGLYEIDPLYVEVKNPSEVKRFYSDYARLEVLKYKIAPVDSTANIYDIIEPYRAPLTLKEIAPWALLAIALAALAWGLVVFLRKLRKQKPGTPEIIIKEPAHVIAFRELEKLKSEELWQKGDYKQYYTRLTEILRQYLENRYKVYSLELTTKETLDALLATGFKRDGEYERLRTVLTAADLVKFAKYVPGIDENDIHYLNSWAFVDATKEIILTQLQGQEQIEGKTEEGGV